MHLESIQIPKSDRILQVLHLYPSYWILRSRWAAFFHWMTESEKLSAINLQQKLVKGRPGASLSSAAGCGRMELGRTQQGLEQDRGVGLLFVISHLAKKNRCCENSKLV